MVEKLKAEFGLNKAHAYALEIAQFVADKAYMVQGGALARSDMVSGGRSLGTSASGAPCPG
jgi:hypothetical protein